MRELIAMIEELHLAIDVYANCCGTSREHEAFGKMIRLREATGTTLKVTCQEEAGGTEYTTLDGKKVSVPFPVRYQVKTYEPPIHPSREKKDES